MNSASTLEANDLHAYKPLVTPSQHPLLQKLLQKIEDLKIIEDIAAKQAKHSDNPFTLSSSAQKVIRQLETEIAELAKKAGKALK